MRVLKLLFFVGLFASSSARAATPEDLLNTLRAALGVGEMNAYEADCKDGLITKSRLIFKFDPAKRLLLLVIQESMIGNYLWTGTPVFVGTAGTKLTNNFYFVDSETREKFKDSRWFISKIALGDRIVSQTVLYSPSQRLIAIQDGSWIHKVAVCHLK